jgi:hypothetical protein
MSQRKVYEFRIDAETKRDGYCENWTAFNVLAFSFDEAVADAKKRLAKTEVIGEVKLICEIDE